jgi:lambda repressor-like predicted transcriptional regulator
MFNNMSESQIVLNPKWQRKALMAEHGVSPASIAASVPCSGSLVRRVINGGNAYDTQNSKRIKQLIADGVGRTVTELWPESEYARTDRTASRSP